jgi:tetratricopeptide (TPR) repeat protein
LLASILNTRGDLAFYQGDFKGAARFYQSSIPLAAKAKNNEVLLLSKVNMARVAIAEGRFADALRALQPFEKAAAPAYLSSRINLAAAQCLIGIKDYQQANHELEQQLTQAQRAGMRFELAAIYYLLGTSARLNGNADRAGDYYREAAQQLDGIRGDPGAENVLRRTDVKVMYDESNRWKK